MTTLNSKKGAAKKPSVLGSLGHAWSAIGRSIWHYGVQDSTYGLFKATKATVNAVTFGELHNWFYAQPKPGSNSGGGGDGSTLPVFQSPSTMKFNLPPHAWSLPRSHADLNNASNPNVPQVDHSTRRAIMWFYGSADTTGGDKLQVPAGSTVNATSSKDIVSYTATPDDNYWGFQFLWNPESVQNVLSRNANVVPSVMDSHGALNGLFTAMEALQFTIVIDRRNDFACFRGLTDPAGYAQFYTSGGTFGVKQNTSAMINDLMKLGTMADVEYIYRMINGSGQKGKSWVNGLGRATADLAFLSPTAIGLKFGPNPDSMSYVGWVESLNVNHMSFTQDMIPIHTEITVNFNAFSRVSLASGN